MNISLSFERLQLILLVAPKILVRVIFGFFWSQENARKRKPSAMGTCAVSGCSC